MRIEGPKLAVMVDDDDLAVSTESRAAVGDDLNDAVKYGKYGSTLRGQEVNAGMPASLAAETAAEGAGLQRPFHIFYKIRRSA